MYAVSAWVANGCTRMYGVQSRTELSTNHKATPLSIVVLLSKFQTSLCLFRHQRTLYSKINSHLYNNNKKGGGGTKDEIKGSDESEY